jgi:hypothetical protein
MAQRDLMPAAWIFDRLTGTTDGPPSTDRTAASAEGFLSSFGMINLNL